MSELTALIVLSGLSGAGKSAALNCLEDLGYYCIDNLPPPLMETFVDLCNRASTALERAALVVDVRTLAFLDQFDEIFRSLRDHTPALQLIFLDADDTVLQQRFSETRRPHPLEEAGGVLEGIRLERQRLATIRELADRVIDTSRLTQRELREFLTAQLGGEGDRLNISVMSFGYRDGLPENADLVFDMRFLPNPNYVPELKELTGMDKPVVQFVESQSETRTFLRHLKELLRFLIPQYAREGKTYLTLAFGCTAGRHRSAVVAGRVVEYLEERGHRVSVAHRDLPEVSRT